MDPGNNNQSENRNASRWKSKACAWSVFAINILLMFLGFQAIKENDKNRTDLSEEETKKTVPVSSEIMNTQSEIATDRENKLRDQNTSPKEIKQVETTTTVTTPDPAPAKSSTKTKTS